MRWICLLLAAGGCGWDRYAEIEITLEPEVLARAEAEDLDLVLRIAQAGSLRLHTRAPEAFVIETAGVGGSALDGEADQPFVVQAWLGTALDEEASEGAIASEEVSALGGLAPCGRLGGGGACETVIPLVLSLD